MGEPRPDDDYGGSIGQQLLDLHTWIRLCPPAFVPEDAVLQPGYQLPIGDASFINTDRGMVADNVATFVHRVADSLEQPAHRRYLSIALIVVVVLVKSA